MPSHEKTTNCGGFWPGFSRSGLGRCGCAPVYAVEPSPIRRTALWGAGAPSASFAPCVPSLEPVAQPASAVAQAAATATPAAILWVAAISAHLLPSVRATPLWAF